MFRIIAITHAIFAVAYAYEDDHEEGSDLWTLLFEGEQVCCPIYIWTKFVANPFGQLINFFEIFGQPIR